MASNKKLNIPPIALTNTLTTNILNPNVTSLVGPVGFTLSQPYLLVKHIRIQNKTGSAATFSLWKGATNGNAAGTEFLNTAKSVPANDALDFFGNYRFDAADFLVGGASAGTTLTIIFDDVEIGISG